MTGRDCVGDGTAECVLTVGEGRRAIGEEEMAAAGYCLLSYAFPPCPVRVCEVHKEEKNKFN